MADTIGSIFLALFFIGFVWFIIALISKQTNTGFTSKYGSGGAFVQPNDLDDATTYIRKKVDSNFRRKNEYEEELKEQLKDIDTEINWLIIKSDPNRKNQNVQDRLVELSITRRKIIEQVRKKYPDVKFD